jgi:peptide deformylase
MKSRLATDCLHFPRVTPREAEMVRSRTIRYRAYDEDTAAVKLAVVGLALTVAMILSMLVVFAIF